MLAYGRGRLPLPGIHNKIITVVGDKPISPLASHHCLLIHKVFTNKAVQACQAWDEGCFRDQPPTPYRIYHRPANMGEGCEHHHKWGDGGRCTCDHFAPTSTHTQIYKPSVNTLGKCTHDCYMFQHTYTCIHTMQA